MTIRVNTKCKQFKKENDSMKKSLLKSIETLGRKIEAAGDTLTKVCNNEALIYDRINGEINVYKTHCRDNTQIRIVYGCEYREGKSIIYIVDYVNKKSNDADYLHMMNRKFKNVKLSDLEFTEVTV